MAFFIVARNPSNDRLIVITENKDDLIATYPTEDDADEAARHVPVCQAWPYAVFEAP